MTLCQRYEIAVVELFQLGLEMCEKHGDAWRGCMNADERALHIYHIAVRDVLGSQIEAALA